MFIDTVNAKGLFINANEKCLQYVDSKPQKSLSKNKINM